MTSSAPDPTHHKPGRTHTSFGFLLFLLGMGMIIYVFWAAHTLFAAPGPTVPTITGTNPNAATNAALTLGASVTGFTEKLLALLVACIAGAVLASLGINMLFTAWNALHPPHPPAPKP